jgi:N-methylhydantoinase A
VKGTRPAYVAQMSGYVDCPVHDRYALVRGDEVVGPALIEERESTCVIGQGDTARVDSHANLIVELSA